MSGQTFYSDNSSNAIADVLMAVGLAEVLGSWLETLGRSSVPILIEDHGTHFQIHLPSFLDSTLVRKVTRPFMVGQAKPIIRQQRYEPSMSIDLRGLAFPYDQMRASAAAYFEQFGHMDQAQRKDFLQNPEAEEFSELRALAPHPDLRVYTYINQMRASTGYNRLLQQWYSNNIDVFRHNLTCVLESFSTLPNPIQSAAEAWDKNMRRTGIRYQLGFTLWQLTNPTSGKGPHSAKANGFAISNRKGFWLLEYLKLVGLFTVGVPLTVNRNADPNSGSLGRKIYVLHPLRAERGTLGQLARKVRPTVSATDDASLDVVTLLSVIRGILEIMQETSLHEHGTDTTRVNLDADVQGAILLRGCDVALYRDMGWVHTLREQTAINLPSWLPSTSSTREIRLAQELLRRHIAIVQTIHDEQRKEGYKGHELLCCYREFLVQGDIDSFLDFAAIYSGYTLSKMRRGRWAKLLTISEAERLMGHIRGKQALTPIFESEGFQAIANAIRHATIIAHIRRGSDAGYPYEVRYNLGQEVRQTAAYPSDFIGILSDFLRSYNSENMRIQRRIRDGSLPNRPDYRRRSLKNTDLYQLVHLTDEYGSELVCRMLIASGHLLGSTGSPKLPSRDSRVDMAVVDGNSEANEPFSAS